ncbi:MAG: 4Fe-4S binding protein, partial [Terriglobia bacterium]
MTEEARETPQVDFTYCNRCGLCGSLCPTGAFTVTDISDKKLVQYTEMISDFTEHIAFCCEIQADDMPDLRSAPPVVLPCLARLNEATLVGAAAEGVKGIWANSSWCDTCVNNNAKPIIEKKVGLSRSLISVFGGSCDIEYSEEPPDIFNKRRLFRKKLPPLADFEPVSRRGFFDNIKEGVIKTGLVLIDNELSNFVRRPGSAGPEYHLPYERWSLLSSIGKLGPSDEVQLETDNFPWRNVRISEACSGCESCILYCPSNALTKERLDDKAVIAFSLSKCVKCDVCRDLCPEKAVTFSDSFLSSSLSERDRRALVSFTSSTCTQCKAEFLSQEKADLCRYCEKKQA